MTCASSAQGVAIALALCPGSPVTLPPLLVDALALSDCVRALVDPTCTLQKEIAPPARGLLPALVLPGSPPSTPLKAPLIASSLAPRLADRPRLLLRRRCRYALVLGSTLLLRSACGHLCSRERSGHGVARAVPRLRLAHFVPSMTLATRMLALMPSHSVLVSCLAVACLCQLVQFLLYSQLCVGHGQRFPDHIMVYGTKAGWE